MTRLLRRYAASERRSGHSPLLVRFRHAIPARSSIPDDVRRGTGRRDGVSEHRSADHALRWYDTMLGEEAAQADVPRDLLKAVCWQASRWRHVDSDGRPLAGEAAHGTAWGCMQLNDVWFPDAFPQAREDARANIQHGATMLRWLYEQTGDWHRATIAFFGHDRRAERAARRVHSYRRLRPWQPLIQAESPQSASDSALTTHENTDSSRPRHDRTRPAASA